MNEKGFTLLEIVIATFVVVVALVGMMTILYRGLVSSSFSANRLVAAYLAQEGIELVRNQRDTNWLQGREDWASNLKRGDEINLLGRFNRTTEVSGEGNKRMVSVTVSWREGNIDYSFSVQTELYNWYYK